MSKRINSRSLDRVVDANYNRAKEGLRVCEDALRFLLDERRLAAQFKDVRHQLTQAAHGFGLKDIVMARDVAGDVGRETIPSERSRVGVEDVFYANVQRVKESLRVLEEFAKISDGKMSDGFKLLRYRVYGLEKKVLARL